MIQKQGNWVPHDLTSRDIERRFVMCQQLLQRQNRKGFLRRIITDDEKWIHYNSPKRKTSWCLPGHKATSTSKSNTHGSKLMLSIWWDQQGVLYYELVQPNERITGERYQKQLIQLSCALKMKRPEYAQRHDKVIFQHDNALPYISRIVKKTLEEFRWEVLPHPPYSRQTSVLLTVISFDR